MAGVFACLELFVPAAKQPPQPPPTRHVNIRSWRWFNERTLKTRVFQVGDPYDGPLNLPGLLTPQGPDGRGPLIAEVAVPAASGASDPTPPDSGAASEEK